MLVLSGHISYIKPTTPAAEHHGIQRLFSMKSLVLILAIATYAVADGDVAHQHEGAHHAATVDTYNQAPADAYVQPAGATDQGYYYYYYPEQYEKQQKKQDFFDKIKQEFDVLKSKTEDWGLSSLNKDFDSTKIFSIVALGLGLLLAGPWLVNALGMGALVTTIQTWVDSLVTSTGGRTNDLSYDDMAHYANVVFDAINKEY